MAQQILDQYQVGAGIEEVGGKTMPQTVRGVTAWQSGLSTGAVKDAPCRIERDRTGRGSAGKQPALRLGQTPVGTQHVEQAWGQDGEALLAAFAANADDHALRMDIVDAHVAGFTQTQAGGVAGHEQGTILGLTQGREERAPFNARQDLGQAAGLTPGKREAADFPRATSVTL